MRESRLPLGKWLRRRGIGFFITGLFFSVGVWVLATNGAQLLAQPIYLNMVWVVASLAVAYLAFAIQVIAWRMVLASYGIRQSLRDDLRIYTYSALGTALPGGIWSVVGRSALYHSLGENGLRAGAASVVETYLIGVAALIVYAGATLIQPGIDIWRRPEVGVPIAVLVLVLIQPSIFNRLSRWIAKRTEKSTDLVLATFTLRDLLFWLGLESLTMIVGGSAVFVLLTSLIVVPPMMLISAIAAWAAAIAVSTLLFWLPGTLVLRDGAMVLALSPGLPVSVAVVFVILVRIWSIASILIVASLAWLFLDQHHNAKAG